MHKQQLKFVVPSLAALLLVLSSAFAATPLGPATWGTPDQPWGTRRPVNPADRALVATYRSGKKQPTFSTNFQDTGQFGTEWKPQSDDKPGLKSCRRPENVQAGAGGLKLLTLKATDCKVDWSTGSVSSSFTQKYGFFEARMKIADLDGMNNAFWLTTPDDYEIDIAEVHYPNYIHMKLCDWNHSVQSHTVGLGIKFQDNFSAGFHDYGVYWDSKEIIFEVDGDPTGVIMTNNSVQGPATVKLSSALGDFAGHLSAGPVGHNMYVQSVKVYAL